MTVPTQQNIEAWLWEAATILRGPVDPANLRDFVFPILFLKRLSDMWDEEHLKLKIEFTDGFDKEIENDFHTFVIPEDCHWDNLKNATENHGVLIQDIIQKIELFNPTKLSNIFGNAAWADQSKMPGERLEKLIKHFSKQDLSPSLVSNDILGGGYEYLLKRFSDESATSAGQFFTPRGVVHLLVRILGPQSNSSIYDPACGSGGMLIEAASEVKQSGGTVSGMMFYGQEINQTSASIGRMNLFIHDVEDCEIKREDTLKYPKFLDNKGGLMQFDIVLANPPFSLKDWGADRWATDPHKRAIGGVPPRNNGDYAWVQHMIASMKEDTGRVGVVLPNGVLFRGGTEGAIRKHLIEEKDLIETIIGLAPNLFYGTTIPASLMFLRSTKDEKRNNHILFIDASKRFGKGKAQNFLTDEDVHDIFTVYQSMGETEKPNITARLVHHNEIKKNDWDLNMGRYLKGEATEVVDVKDALTSFKHARIKLLATEKALLAKLKAAGYA